ncbi:MAG: OB-fold nucleic acid binding domain-containing protein, partial [Gammaproteobacteria bacterium]
MSTLQDIPCTQLKGVGSQTAARLHKCGIVNVQDLLFHLPYRYQDRTRISPISDLRVGDHTVVEGTIISSQVKQGRRRMLICDIEDGSGVLKIRFFHFNVGLKQALACDTRVRCFGEVRGRGRQIEMIHPEFHCLATATLTPVEETLRPIYPSTEGLGQQTLFQLIDQALVLLNGQQGLDEYIPQTIREHFDLIDLAASIQTIHRPSPDVAMDLLLKGIHPAQQRLAFEELLAYHLSMRLKRQRLHAHRAPVFSESKLRDQLTQTLEFQLTSAQQRVVTEI